LEAGVQSALIHGGTSTVCAIGTPPEADAWKVAIPAPPLAVPPDPPQQVVTAGLANVPPIAVVSLKDEALSVSGVHGKCFRAGGRTYGHVIDPRTGAPAQAALVAAVTLPSAPETDAFSTALLLAGIAGHDSVAALRREMRTLVVEGDSGQLRLAAKGISALASSPATSGCGAE
jgi:FAD:protein FMN transferase